MKILTKAVELRFSNPRDAFAYVSRKFPDEGEGVSVVASSPCAEISHELFNMVFENSGHVVVRHDLRETDTDLFS